MNALTALPLLLSAMLSPGAALAQGADPLAAAAWLAGCWAAEGKEAGSGEQWTQPAGGTMLGVGRTVKNGKTVDFEFMQLRSTPDGKLVFIALPSGQRETTFVQVLSAPGALVFENLQHDFPQRVIYRWVSNERLNARIEGLRSGVLRGVDVSLMRTACAAPSEPTR